MIIPDVFQFLNEDGSTYMIPMKVVQSIELWEDGHLGVSAVTNCSWSVPKDKADDFLRLYRSYTIRTSPTHIHMRHSNDFVDRVLETLDDVHLRLSTKGANYKEKIVLALGEIQSLEKAFEGSIVHRKQKSVDGGKSS